MSRRNCVLDIFSKELAMVGTPWTRPVQAYATPNLSMPRGIGHTILPKSVELLTNFSFWRGSNSFLKRECPHSSGTPHIQEYLGTTNMVWIFKNNMKGTGWLVRVCGEWIEEELGKEIGYKIWSEDI